MTTIETLETIIKHYIITCDSYLKKVKLYLLFSKLRLVNSSLSKLIDDNEEYINLEGIDLEGTNLQSADLGGANLRRANLIGANLQGANLKDADLRKANLKGANLIDTILESVN